MPIYALGDLEPDIHPDAYVHPDAVVIGNVTIGATSSVWPQVVLRGDDGEIRIGNETSVQDGTVIHCTAFHPTVVGDRCVIGHVAHLEGCTVHDDALVGSNSVVLHEAIIESGALVAAGAVVTGKTVVPTGALAVGVPAKIIEGAANRDLIKYSAQSYVERGRRFSAELRRLD